MSQIVQHKSRSSDVTFSFPSVETTLTWSFTQPDYAEVYEVTLVNIASYNVSGNSTLPITLAKNVSYTITITKTTNGQTASITLKTRRAVYATATISIPNLSAYDGRYLYAISHTAQNVYKIDKSLFVASNYIGAGVFTVNPIVATIALPTTIANSIGAYPKYSCMSFNVIDGMMYFLAGDTTRQCLNICKLNSSDAMMDMDGTANLSTRVFNSTTAVSDIPSTLFSIDHINNKAIINSHTTTGSFIYTLNIPTKTATALTVFASQPRSGGFNPSYIAHIANGDYNEYKVFNYKQGTSGFIFNRTDSKSYGGFSNLIYRIRNYTFDGVQTINNVSNSINNTVTPRYAHDYTNNRIGIMGRGLYFAWSTLPGGVITEVLTPAGILSTGGYDNMIFSGYSGDFVLSKNNRIVGFNYTAGGTFWGYIDVAANITDMAFNTLL